MEEKKLSEQESLELISQMIQMTKENLERGSGNVFLTLYTLCAVSVRAEGTFGRLRYSLGGDRPSQTARQTLSSYRVTVQS